MPGNHPGIAPARLTPDPLADEGQLSVGPDHLNPAIPEQRDELVDRGYLPDDDVDAVGGADDAAVATDPLFDPLGSSLDDPPRGGPIGSGGPATDEPEETAETGFGPFSAPASPTLDPVPALDPSLPEW